MQNHNFIVKKAIQRPKNDPIIFTSEDSMNTDNSFNSSIDGENNEDYKNSFWHLKEQMQQFFVQNPNLQNDIKFDQFRFSEDESSDKEQNQQQNQAQKKNAKLQVLKNALQQSKQNKQQQKEVAVQISEQSQVLQGSQSQGQISQHQQQQKSKLWTTLCKDIIKNGQLSQQQVPTLETVNHRLNIFKQKIEKVDYLELLTKDTQKDKKQTEKEKSIQKKEKEEGGNGPINGSIQSNTQGGNGGNQKNNNQNSKNQKGEGSEGEEKDLSAEEVKFFSFKKKQEKIAKEKRQRQIEKMETQKTEHRGGLITRGIGEAGMFKSNMMINGQIIYHRPQTSTGGLSGKKNTNFSKFEETVEKVNFDQDMEFHSQFGKVLYQTLKQYQNDVESFKKTASFILRDYNNNKAKLYKSKVFPPQIPKFTSDETKHLNILLPDFSAHTQQSKQQAFQNLDNYQVADDAPESQFINTIDSILNGKVMELWKQSQNNV